MAKNDDVIAICVELDNLFEQYNDAIEKRDFERAIPLLQDHFSKLRFSHARGILPDEEMTHYLHAWEKGTMRLFPLSPEDAFMIARNALYVCAQGEEGLPCDTLIGNTVCVCVNLTAAPAAYHHIARFKQLSLNKIDGFIIPLADVLKCTVGHTDSQNLQNTFYEALTEFEEMTFSALVPPVTRFMLVNHLHKWSQNNLPKSQALLDRMDELLKEATFLPNGQGIIQLELEIQADELARESKEWFSKKPIGIEFGHALRAGVSSNYTALYQKIERSFKGEDYKTAEKSLYVLFHRLSADAEDDNGGDIPEDVSTCDYLRRTADKLASSSLKNGFRLASRCINAIEDESIYSEQLQATVFGFAVPIIADWESQQHGNYKATSPLNLAIMKRSSEFIDEEIAEDIFERAAIGYREYLGSISPYQRYDELLEISEWLGERKCESLMLQDFVDSLMNMATRKGNFMAIALEEDESARIHGFPSLVP